MNTVEKALLLIDVALAFVFGLIAIAYGLVGVLFGLLSYGERGTLGGHEWTLGMAVVWGLTTANLVLAAVGIRQKKSWKWYAQCSPPFIFGLGFFLVLVL
jgi:hypothetical protein